MKKTSNNNSDYFTKSDIKWVRNVKRDHGLNWAYPNEKGEFILHWSTKAYSSAKEALKPNRGEIILIYQRPQKINKNVCLNYLVTPVDDFAIDCEKDNPDFKWGRLVRVIASSITMDSIVKPIELNFSKVSRQHTFRIELITYSGKKNIHKVREIIWNCFNPNNISKEKTDDIDFRIELSSLEGGLIGKEKVHYVRERSSALVNEKKKQAIETGNVSCECCGLIFYKKYGSHGKDYIECHHTNPINLGERITRLEDLALVCSNCHRMLHRKSNNEKYLTIEELKELIIPSNKFK